MNNIDNSLTDQNFTVVLTINGSVTHHALVAKEPLSAFKGAAGLGIPITEKQFAKAYRKHGGRRMQTIAQTKTQYVTTTLGDPDFHSKCDQWGLPKRTKDRTGKTIAVWDMTKISVKDWIAAAVMSQFHDRVGGKWQGAVFTYKTIDYETTMRWDTEARKFV